MREYSKIVDQLFSGNTIENEKAKIESSNNSLVNELVKFLNAKSLRGLCKYERK